MAAGPYFSGGDEGIRTPGLCPATAALSQLSYIPAKRALAIFAVAAMCVKAKKTCGLRGFSALALYRAASLTPSCAAQKKSPPAAATMNPPLKGGHPHRAFRLPQQRRMPVLNTECRNPKNTFVGSPSLRRRGTTSQLYVLRLPKPVLTCVWFFAKVVCVVCNPTCVYRVTWLT